MKSKRMTQNRVSIYGFAIFGSIWITLVLAVALIEGLNLFEFIPYPEMDILRILVAAILTGTLPTVLAFMAVGWACDSREHKFEIQIEPMRDLACLIVLGVSIVLLAMSSVLIMNNAPQYIVLRRLLPGVLLCAWGYIALIRRVPRKTCIEFSHTKIFIVVGGLTSLAVMIASFIVSVYDTMHRSEFLLIFVVAAIVFLACMAKSDDYY